MKVYDVSIPIRADMPTYDGEPGPVLDFRRLMSKGDPLTLSAISLGSHTGTHVDAPAHFLDGAPGIDSLSLDVLVGPAYVAEFAGDSHITAADVKSMAIPPHCQRLLLKTRNSRFWDDDSFHQDFIALAPDAAKALVRRDIQLVGIDYLSIEPFHADPHDVHETLLGNGIVIVEGLDLRRIAPGPYLLVCAPLNVVGAEGAPARTFLIDQTA